MFGIKEFAFVPPPYGGVSIYVKRLIERLNSLGIKTGGYYLPQCKDFSIRESNLFQEWAWMPTHLFFVRIFKYIRETKHYKIIHSHFSLEGMLYLWFLKSFCKKIIVVTVHNSMVANYLKRTNLINRFFLKRMARSAKVTWIAVSEQAKMSLLALPISFGSDIMVIPAYIPFNNNSIHDLIYELHNYIGKHEKILVFYGHSFMKYNNHDVYGFEEVLKMFASFSDEEQKQYGLIFCIANSSDKESLSTIMGIASSMGIAGRIYWQIGPIENMASIWKHTDVYIRPTFTDGDSVAVREALDMGVQVVASDVCERPKDVITYPYGDINMMTDAVRMAILQGKRTPNNDETFFNQMLNVYMDLLGK